MHTVDELMTASVHTAHGGDLVGTVRDVMRAENIHAVPVVGEGGAVVGIVSSTDLLEDVSPEQPVESVMSKPVYTVGRHTTLIDAAREMVEHRIHHLVVADRGGVVGMISSFDLMRHLAGRVEQLAAMHEASTLRAAVGDTLVVRSRQVGGRERRARVVEVHGENGAGPYTVWWSDDQHDKPHLTMFFPGSDTYVEAAESG